ncbi:MAG: hypothetical protein RLN89_13480 [Parvibaculum sp.]
MHMCLIADPSHLARRVAIRVSERLGFHAMEVTSADGLRKAFRLFQPALTLVDEGVAEGNLGALMASLRYGIGGGDRTLIVTGHDRQTPEIEAALIGGADDFLRKPLSDAALSILLQRRDTAEKMAVGQSAVWSGKPRLAVRETTGCDIIQIADWR